MLKKSVQNKNLLTWDDVPGLKLSPPILAGLKVLNFKGPKPVQAATIPLFLNHKDVCVEAITGSGKTLAFVLPILEILYSTKNLNKFEVRAIILTPTQELARQIYDVITQNFTQPAHVTPAITCQLFTGGVRSPSSDLARFAAQGGHVIVATPGRLEWLLGGAAPPFAVGGEDDTHRVMTTFARCVSSCDILVLDEADRLLDMGLSDTIEVIIGHLPKQRRTCLFSATLNEKVDCLIKAGLRNPISVVVKESPTSGHGQNHSATLNTARTPASLSCFYALCRPENKFPLLLDLLNSHPTLGRSKKTMVFMSSLFAAQYYAKALKLHIEHQGGMVNLEVLVIHRKMRSSDRATVLARFRDAKVGQPLQKRLVLMCTDVVARGIDIPDVEWVIHFDAPSSIERFLHRSGRTARSERLGNALLILLPNEEPFIEFLALNRGLVVGPLSQCPPTVEHSHEKEVLEIVRRAALRDRAYMLKGIKAFVSYVRAYAQHQCRLIFRLKDLDLGACATGYALLYLPKMPEISQQARREAKHKQLDRPEPGQTSARLSSFLPPYPDLNPKATIPYADPELEKGRLAKIDLAVRARRAKKVTEIKEQKRRAIVSKIKNKTSRDSHKLTRRERSKIKQTLDARDIAEIGKDAKMLKKLKNKKITESAFDKAFYAGL